MSKQGSRIFSENPFETCTATQIKALSRRLMRSLESGFACLLVASVALVTSISPSSAQDDPVAKIETAQTIVAGQDRDFYGRVVALETVDLAFQVGGQIVELPIIEGDTIATGAMIAALDRVPFELALAEANASYTQALRTLERLEQLSGRTISQASVDDARTALDLARVQVDRAQRALDQAVLVSPFDALVSSRLLANQSTVGAGVPVVRLHNMSEIRIEINVPEVLFQRAGRDSDVTLSAVFPASEQRFPLEVREFNAETAAVGQTYTITLGMAPPDDLNILPGASVVVETKINNLVGKVTVPRSALLFATDGTPQVMVFDPTDDKSGVVKVVDVEITPAEHGEVIVTSGLEVGQEYVAAGPTLLQGGQTVTRFTGFGE